jgi:hypothetical protein
MPSSGTLGRVVLVGTDISEERIASIIRVERISDLWTILAVTSNRRTLGTMIMNLQWHWAVHGGARRCHSQGAYTPVSHLGVLASIPGNPIGDSWLAEQH